MKEGSQPTIGQNFYGQLTDNEFRTDWPHFYSQNDKSGLTKIDDIPQCELERYENSLECDATHYNGAWFDSFVSRDADSLCLQRKMELSDAFKAVPFLANLFSAKCPYKTDMIIESLMECPAPHWYNTGPHRIMIVAWYKGERYVVAVEEAKGIYRENIFIEGLTEKAKERLKDNKHYAFAVMESISKATAGKGMFKGGTEYTYLEVMEGPRYVNIPFLGVKLYYDHSLLDEGCTPSPLMHDK